MPIVSPIVEYYPINTTQSQVNYQILDINENNYTTKVVNRLKECNGIYIFYNSIGKALYVGKAEEQNIWDEINNAFNRERRNQDILQVIHPQQAVEFKNNRRIVKQQVCQYDIAVYFSAYKVNKKYINAVEAFLIRCFANNLLNIKMENIPTNILAQPVVEYYPIYYNEHDNGRCSVLGEEESYHENVINELKNQNGLFIFYDSTYKAIYTGITEAGNLWNSINNVYNQESMRDIYYVDHPNRDTKLIENRRIYSHAIYMYDISYYFSAYKILNNNITTMRALLTRCFANDLLNQVYNF